MKDTDKFIKTNYNEYISKIQRAEEKITKSLKNKKEDKEKINKRRISILSFLTKKNQQTEDSDQPIKKFTTFLQSNEEPQGFLKYFFKKKQPEQIIMEQERIQKTPQNFKELKLPKQYYVLYYKLQKKKLSKAKSNGNLLDQNMWKDKKTLNQIDIKNKRNRQLFQNLVTTKSNQFPQQEQQSVQKEIFRSEHSSSIYHFPSLQLKPTLSTQNLQHEKQSYDRIVYPPLFSQGSFQQRQGQKVQKIRFIEQQELKETHSRFPSVQDPKSPQSLTLQRVKNIEQEQQVFTCDIGTQDNILEIFNDDS